jgi:ketosteroid isomerase-like protein
MTTAEVAKAFAQLCKSGNHDGAGARFWADDVVSREAMDGPMAELRGKAALKAKGDWWYDNHEIHSVETEGPFIHGNQFALRFAMDVTAKQSGERIQMAEIGLYTVADGKVVEERFFY